MKAIALVSGGLDSTLAVRLLKEQGIEIIILNFKTPFCLCDRKTSSGCGNFARKVADSLDIEFRVVNVTNEFFDILKNPRYGYGSNMNPCIDCRILFLRKAKEFMQRVGARFIITGEVLGQRPMSQHKQALKLIERESGLEGLVLRPLSAKLLEETLPEREGWIDRDKLLSLSGRTRKPQMELAKTLEIKDYPCAAGGCLLTDPGFAKRVKDLIAYGELNLNNVELLKTGRHFRLSRSTKLIVGRDERENSRLLDLAKENDYLFSPSDIKGPASLGRGVFDEGLIRLSCSITCRYCDLDGEINAELIYSKVPERQNKVLKVSPVDETTLTGLRI